MLAVERPRRSEELAAGVIAGLVMMMSEKEKGSTTLRVPESSLTSVLAKPVVA